MTDVSEVLSMEELTHKFRDEWVIVEVLEVDECDEPRKVRIVAASKNRDEIYERQKRVKGDVAILYTGQIPKKGYAVAFCG